MSSSVSSLAPHRSPAAPDRWPTAAARAIHPSSSGPIGDVLATLATRLAALADPSEHGSGGVATERRYARLLSTPAFEAWLICWPQGASLELHDHGPSAGAFAVVTGTLDETWVDQAGQRTRRVGASEVVSFGRGHIHDVANGERAPAISVHVYSPPLSTMTFYDVTQRGLTAVRTEWTGGPG
jgi:quercetin dioxygenase-like cupin family protein